MTWRTRAHVAAVHVNDDLKALSIKYQDSANPNYTSTSIHKNHDGWMQDLENAIKAQLSSP